MFLVSLLFFFLNIFRSHFFVCRDSSELLCMYLVHCTLRGKAKERRVYRSLYIVYYYMYLPMLCSLEARTMEATATHNVLGFHALLRSVAAAAALLYTLCLQMITLENLQQQDR